MLRFFLFGSPHFEDAGTTVPLRHSKPLALLAYLALSRQPCDRETLLGLLWPDFDSSSARNNLRRELSRLKIVLGAELLVADRRQVRWDPHTPVWVDVAAFQAHLSTWKQHGHANGAVCSSCAAELASAVELYRDDFLAGLGVPDSPAFDEWQFFVREELRQQLARVLEALIGWHERAGAYDTALIYARRWLQLDPLHEPGQRALMRLYALAGQWSAAQRQYAVYVRLLAEELDAEPEAETRALFESIRSKRLFAPATGAEPYTDQREIPSAPATPPPPPARPASRLPPRFPGFVGRRGELADLLARLTDPDCRLLTLTGPGGVGKTRLALEAAHTVAVEWAGVEAIADGVLWVPLAAVPAPSGIGSALAAASELEFAPEAPPQQQLLDFFRARRMLIVLDNFEHLLGGADLLAALLSTAPGLRLLVTSREALNLREEWLQPVAGLSFPARNDPVADAGTLGRFDAVRLFEQHARRLRPDFAFSRDYEHVVRLCRLVEGMPLAIELAASWLKTVSVEYVVTALGSGLDILTSRDRNISERHRSLRLVLEQSWRMLSVDEQQVVARLTVFRGSFSAPAAEKVAGAALSMLATLVEKSLLRSAEGGRFAMHELVRQFATEHLAADHDLRHAVEARHNSYYLDLLAEREARLAGGDRHVAVAEIAAEAENVRAAWLRAVDQADYERVDRVLLSCFDYYEARGYCQEGDELFSRVVEGMQATARSATTSLAARVRARALIRRGVFRTMLGAYGSAGTDLERGLAAARAIDLHAEVAYAHMWRGVLAKWRGDPAAARQELDAAVELATPTGDKLLAGQTLYELSLAVQSGGDYTEAKRLAQQSLALLRVVGRKDQIGRALDRLALVLAFEGDYSAAEAHWRESLALAEEIGNQTGVANAAGGMGWTAWCAGGDLKQAQVQLEYALAIARRLGLRVLVSDFLGDLAVVALEQGAYARAEAYAREGLHIAREIDSVIFIGYNLGILGQIAALRQEFDAARRSLREALQIAASRELWPLVGRTVYIVADLFRLEAQFAGSSDPRSVARQTRAVELLAAIAQHPASWHLYRARARHRLDELLQELPATEIATAVARGQRFDWPASVRALVDELLQPGPVS